MRYTLPWALALKRPPSRNTVPLIGVSGNIDINFEYFEQHTLEKARQGMTQFQHVMKSVQSIFRQQYFAIFL
jgi:hypothetical protein